MKQSTIICAAGAMALLFSCNKNPLPPSLTTIPVEDFHNTKDAKEIFRRSDFNNTSSWVIPDEKGDLKIQLGRENAVRNLWTKADPLAFSMKGGAENTVRIDVPPIGDSESMDVPFSFEIPWSLSSDAVPETYKRLLEIGLYQRGSFRYNFGEDMPFTTILPDIQLILPSCISPEPDDFDVLPDQNGYRFYIRYYEGTSSEGVKMIASFEVPDDYQSAPEHMIRLDSVITVKGVLHLEKKRLKKGEEWPDHLDLTIKFTHEGDLFQAKGILGLPSEYTIPDISFGYDLQIKPYLFQASYPNTQSPNLHLFDMRVRLDYLNRTPFKTRLRGKVASYKNGEVLHSVPFGIDVPIEAKEFDADCLIWNWETVCEKTIFLSEFNRFPVSFPGADYSDYQEHASLQVNGLSELFVGDPDDIRFTDLRVERDPDEIVDIRISDFENASLKLNGQITTPLRVEKDFSAITDFPLYLAGELLEKDIPVHRLILEGTFTSTLPFNIELINAVSNEDVTVSWSKVLLPPSFNKEASSTHFSLQVESDKDLKELWSTTSLLFRLFADESCAGKPINESDGITLTDVVVKY